MKTWEEIRDEVAGMLADGQPLEDIISKLEQRKNEMAKAELIAVFDELKKPKPHTNEAWFCSLSTEEKAKWLSRHSQFIYGCGQKGQIPKALYEEDWEHWLKEKNNA